MSPNSSDDVRNALSSSPASGENTPSSSLDRRGFLGKAAIVAGGAALTACGPGAEAGTGGESASVITGPRVRWRLASSFPRSLDTIFGGAEHLSEIVSTLSEGRFTIRAHPAGEVVPGLEVMDAVQQGTVQMGQTVSYYFSGKNPALVLDSTLPFGLTARQHGAWINAAGGLDLVRAIYADFGIISFPGGNTGGQMGGWFKREVDSVADVRGLKMRIPGAGGEVMNRLGATVQVLPGGEIYPALERGAIDAAEWVGPYDDEKLGFQTAARFYYYPGWWEPGAELVYQVNRRAWDELPSAYQEIFRYAAAAAAANMVQRYDHQNAPALQRLIAGGTQLRRFSDEILRAAQTAAHEIAEENATKDAAYRRIYEHWKAFREDAFRWFGTTELAYQNFAFGEKRG